MKKYLNPEITVVCLNDGDAIRTSYESYIGDPAEKAPSYWAQKLKNL